MERSPTIILICVTMLAVIGGTVLVVVYAPRYATEADALSSVLPEDPKADELALYVDALYGSDPSAQLRALNTLRFKSRFISRDLATSIVAWACSSAFDSARHTAVLTQIAYFSRLHFMPAVKEALQARFTACEYRDMRGNACFEILARCLEAIDGKYRVAIDQLNDSTPCQDAINLIFAAK